MKLKICFVIFLLVLISLHLKAQIGGKYTYQFLELPYSARVAALGGVQIAVADSGDLNTIVNNPALLNGAMNNNIVLTYVNYLSDVSYGYTSFCKSVGGLVNFAVGIQFIDYGKFKGATEQGSLTGNYFDAAEYALNIIISGKYKNLDYGIDLKPIFSVFEKYSSVGLVVDLGVMWSSKDANTNIGVVAKNIGGQISTYYDGGGHERVPFNLQVGVSRKLKYAPFIFYFSMQHLTNWDLAWSDEYEKTLENWHDRDEGLIKQFFRHAVLGVEVMPIGNFIVRAGYNYQRRQELKFEERVSTVGLSLGVGVKMKRFRIDLSSCRYHLAGASTLVSLAIDLGK